MRSRSERSSDEPSETDAGRGRSPGKSTLTSRLDGGGRGTGTSREGGSAGERSPGSARQPVESSLGADRDQPDPFGLHLLWDEAGQRGPGSTTPGDQTEREADPSATRGPSSAAAASAAAPAVAPAAASDAAAAAAFAATPTADSVELSLFAKAFIAEFKPILGEAFGGEAAFTPAVAATLFTPKQRALLSGFFLTHVLPEGLFTGAAGKSAANTKQRTLMAGHMLSHGTFVHQELGPDHGKEEKPHAQFCGHWALFVWQYAGVMPAEGMGYPGALESIGPTGETSFGGGGKLEKGDITLMNECGSGVRRKPLGYPNHAEMVKIFDKDTLQPGDWIYIDNGKPAGHSEIFAGWADSGPQTGTGNDDTLLATSLKPVKVLFRRAWVYSQRDNEKTWNKAGGGDRHMETISVPYAKDFHPVTAIFRPNADSGPPDTPEKLLPFNRTTATGANLKTIDKEKLDYDKLRTALWTEADHLLATSKQLQNFEDSQRALSEKILGENTDPTIDAITTLAALVQRLRLGKVTGVVSLDLLGGAAWPRRDEVAKTGKLDFPYDSAIEHNRHYTRMQKLDPAKLAPLVADVVRARPAKDKAKFEKEKAKEPAHFSDDKDRFDELFDMYESGTDLKSLSILIALWQFLKDSKTVDGWTENYEQIVGKKALASAKT